MSTQFPGVHHGAEMFHLDRGVADDLQQLLVVPHIIFARGNVQITDQNGAIGLFPMEPVPHIRQEIQFLAEFFVHLAVGHITAGGDIAIVDRHPVFQPRRHMPCMAHTRRNHGRPRR